MERMIVICIFLFIVMLFGLLAWGESARRHFMLECGKTHNIAECHGVM